MAPELPREWFEQLTAEQRVMVRVNGRDSYRWVARRKRNEVLDCRNYALHAAYSIGLHTLTDKRWQKIEATVQPALDLFPAGKKSTPAPQPSGQSTAEAPRPAAPKPQPDPQRPARPTGRAW